MAQTFVQDVCNAIVQVLLPKYIKWPTGESLTDTVQGFERNLNVLVPLMVLTYPSFLLNTALQVGIPARCY